MEEDYSYKKQIKSNKNHLFALEIKIKENNLHFNSSITENYITYNYLGKFYLKHLRLQLNRLTLGNILQLMRIL